ncbi:hydroxymethylpyrimidine/phosphomethylpyrimidine kinase [Amylibacter marinus]|uniref:hydroxymethylpyrimidine kinase n=1 Tax=Amylibacter marinus TaxID=1475483 RepID=A0ABQ5VSM1_9RHOB|nr:bifunctional hydroxymethylpyrimidine kinase/phosphomethylpyrimidine kinase [Amylibacter marinus]GLQ34176.1 hydroxymethylpyrimidine/phosphomethylpyrimidine kinase [Amylibacter marinus]
MRQNTSIALTIAGSDSGGGAGIQADLKAMSANGVFAASVLTAITAQNTTSVTAVHQVPADIVAAQIDAVLSDLDVGAIKLGMLFSPDIIDAVSNKISSFQGAVVVDPVMIAKSGDALLQDAAVSALEQHMLPQATLLTPNLPEAARLLGTQAAKTPAEMADQAQALLAMGPKAVLMKGGHGLGATCTDILVNDSGVIETIHALRVDTKNTHGTGCTYSAAIAAELAKGQDLRAAVNTAHAYLQGAINAADRLNIGQGHGPVHHFFGQWA